MVRVVAACALKNPQDGASPHTVRAMALTLFDEFFRPAAPATRTSGALRPWDWNMMIPSAAPDARLLAIDIHENGDHFKVKADLPGYG